LSLLSNWHFLEDEKLQQIIQDYYTSFEKLFGDQYRKNIDNIYFVISHCDKSSVEIGRILELINERLMGAIEVDKPQLIYFMSRIMKKHLIVDYKNDTSEDLMRRLLKLMDNSYDSNIDSATLLPRLDVKENELDIEMVSDLKSHLKKTQEEWNSLWNEINGLRDSTKQTIQKVKEKTEKKAENQQELEKLLAFLSGVEDKISNIKKERTSAESELDFINKEIESQAIIVKSIGKSLRDQYFIDFRADYSKPESATLGFGAVSHVYDSDLFYDAQTCSDRVILITKVEDDDKTFRQYLKNKNNSLIPETLRQVSTFTNEIVLYNGGIYYNSELKVVSNFDELKKKLSIYIKHKAPFKVFIYYNQKLLDSQIHSKLNLVFESAIERFNKRYKEVSMNILSFSTNIDSLIEETKDKRNKKDETSNVIMNLEVELNEMSSVVNKQKSYLLEKMKTFNDNVSNAKNNALYVQAVKIKEILDQNSLGNNIGTQINALIKFWEETAIKIANTEKYLLN